MTSNCILKTGAAADLGRITEFRDPDVDSSLVVWAQLLPVFDSKHRIADRLE